MFVGRAVTVLVHTTELDRVEDFDENVLEETDEGKVGHYAQAEVAAEYLLLGYYRLLAATRATHLLLPNSITL